MGPDGESWHHHGPPPGMFGPGHFGPESFLPPMLTALVILLMVAGALWALRRPVVAIPPPRDEGRRRWSAAVARHQRVAEAYAAFECDAVEVLRLPALADVRLGPTSRFVDAFAEAGALLTERYPGPDLARRFAAAVEGEGRAWDAAREAARRFRDARFDPDERALIDQTRTLLDVVASSAFEPERHVALRTALRRLAELEKRTGWRLPTPAVLAVEQQARGALAVAPQHG